MGAMTVITGPVPDSVPGEVITPAAILDPNSVTAHEFANVLRAMAKVSTAFKSEADLTAALDVIDSFERRLIPMQDRKHVVSEDDEAGREDVSRRNPGIAGRAVVPPPGAAPLDYEKLARAIILARQEAEGGNS